MQRVAGAIVNAVVGALIALATDSTSKPSPALRIFVAAGVLALLYLIVTSKAAVSRFPFLAHIPGASKEAASGEALSGGDSQKTTGDHSPAIWLQSSPVTIDQSSPAASRQVLEPPLHRALADGLSELELNCRKLARAEQDKYLESRPSDNHYRPLANRLIDQGWHDSRRILDEAYGACAELWDGLHAPGRGPAEFAGMGVIPRIEDSDDVPGVRAKVEAAVTELRRLQDALT